MTDSDELFYNLKEEVIANGKDIKDFFRENSMNESNGHVEYHTRVNGIDNTLVMISYEKDNDINGEYVVSSVVYTFPGGMLDDFAALKDVKAYDMLEEFKELLPHSDYDGLYSIGRLWTRIENDSANMIMADEFGFDGDRITAFYLNNQWLFPYGSEYLYVIFASYKCTSYDDVKELTTMGIDVPRYNSIGFSKATKEEYEQVAKMEKAAQEDADSKKDARNMLEDEFG